MQSNITQNYSTSIQADSEVYLPFLSYFLGKTSKINSFKTFLDVGCGKGESIKEFADKSPDTLCVGMEINREVLYNIKKDNKSNIQLVCASALNLPFMKECADFIVCSHVLEHVSNDRKVLEEIHDTLKQDGLFFLSAPKDFTSFLPLFIPLCYYTGRGADHVRSGYKIKKLKKRLAQDGFVLKGEIIRPQIFWIMYWYLVSVASILRSIVKLSLSIEEPKVLQGLKYKVIKIDTSLPERHYLDPGFRFILEKIIT